MDAHQNVKLKRTGTAPLTIKQSATVMSLKYQNFN